MTFHDAPDPYDLRAFKGAHPKEAQLARGERVRGRRKASKRRWEQIAEHKQGPCRICGGAPPNELHHLAPRAHGGSDTESNVVPLCHRCHGRVTRYDREACATLRLSLSDSEYAYCAEVLGESQMEARYPVAYRCVNPEADYIADVARDSAPFAERANQKLEAPR